MPEDFFDNFPMIGSWQFFAGWLIGGLLLWGVAWFFLFRDSPYSVAGPDPRPVKTMRVAAMVVPVRFATRSQPVFT